MQFIHERPLIIEDLMLTSKYLVFLLVYMCCCLSKVHILTFPFIHNIFWTVKPYSVDTFSFRKILTKLRIMPYQSSISWVCSVNGGISVARLSKPFVWSSSRIFLQDSNRSSTCLEVLLLTSRWLCSWDTDFDLAEVSDWMRACFCWRKAEVVSSNNLRYWFSTFWHAWRWTSWKWLGKSQFKIK